MLQHRSRLGEEVERDAQTTHPQRAADQRVWFFLSADVGEDVGNAESEIGGTQIVDESGVEASEVGADDGRREDGKSLEDIGVRGLGSFVTLPD